MHHAMYVSMDPFQIPTYLVRATLLYWFSVNLISGLLKAFLVAEKMLPQKSNSQQPVRRKRQLNLDTNLPNVTQPNPDDTNVQVSFLFMMFATLLLFWCCSHHSYSTMTNIF